MSLPNIDVASIRERINNFGTKLETIRKANKVELDKRNRLLNPILKSLENIKIPRIDESKELVRRIDDPINFPPVISSNKNSLTNALRELWTQKVYPGRDINDFKQLVSNQKFDQGFQQ